MISILRLFRNQFSTKAKSLLNVNIKKETKDGYDKSQFLDYKIVTVIGGNGADGTISLAKVFCNPMAGPDGGDGGSGGHVIFKSCSQTLDLRNIESIIRGRNGDKGMGKGMDGANGENVVCEVPIGTLIKKFDSNEILADLIKDEDFYIAARGGEGGKGNKFFLSDLHRAPTIAERGGNGEIHKLCLEVKLLADIGLVGVPNAGKSTLLRALTRAKPKVASYAFTTIRPHIGKIDFINAAWDPITICDIPGIIEDSHKNRGLGLEFLRHIERCHILAFIIDLSDDPINQFWILSNELSLHRPLLMKIPRVIICNKMDLPGTRKTFEDFKAHLRKLDDSSSVLAISAMNSVNLNAVVSEMRSLRDRHITDMK